MISLGFVVKRLLFCLLSNADLSYLNVMPIRHET